MQEVLNKLHGGRLIISDDEIDKAKDAYRRAKRSKATTDVMEISKQDTVLELATIQENQNDIMDELMENTDTKVPDIVRRSAVLGMGISADELLNKHELEQDEWDTRMLEERERQKWLLQNRLKRRIHPKYNDEIINEQIALSELELRRELLNDMKENDNANAEQAKQAMDDKSKFIAEKLDGIDISDADKAAFTAAIGNIDFADIDEDADRLKDDIRKNYRKRKAKQKQTLESIHQAELAELGSSPDFDMEQILRRQQLELEAADAELEQEMNAVLADIDDQAEAEKANRFDEKVRSEANQKLPPAAAIAFIQAYKNKMNDLNARNESARIKRKYDLEERRKKRLAAKNGQISDDIQNMYETGTLFKTQNPNYNEYRDIDDISSAMKRANDKDQKLQAELDRKQRALADELNKEDVTDIQKFDQEAKQTLEQLEADLEQKRLSLITSGDTTTDMEALMADFNRQRDELMLNARTDNIRRRAKLEAALRQRRRKRLTENASEADVAIKKQEAENKKDMEIVKKKNIQKSELAVIKAGIKENGGDDAIKIVKSVLDARHQEELAELEDRYGIEREQLLLDCPEEDRIKVLSDWEYRMNMDIVKLRQVHYDELIKYLEQVSPKTAESIKANNEKREKKKREIENYQKELDENFKNEREKWEADQNKLMEDKLRAKEDEFDAELQKELEALEKLKENKSDVDDIRKKLEGDMRAAVEAAKANGASQDEIDQIMNNWQNQEAAAIQQSEVRFTTKNGSTFLTPFFTPTFFSPTFLRQFFFKKLFSKFKKLV